jgi:hypothetical protein
MHAGTVLFFALFDGEDFASKARELEKLFLDLLQTFLALAVSDLRLSALAIAKAVKVVQYLNLCNFRPKTADLFAKNL